MESTIPRGDTNGLGEDEVTGSGRVDETVTLALHAHAERGFKISRSSRQNLATGGRGEKNGGLVLLKGGFHREKGRFY